MEKMIDIVDNILPEGGIYDLEACERHLRSLRDEINHSFLLSHHPLSKKVLQTIKHKLSVVQEKKEGMIVWKDNLNLQNK
jgi:hypothetical protein